MRKVISLLMSLALLLVLAMPAAAATVKQEIRDSLTEVSAGEQIQIDVTLDEAVTGIATFEYRLYYDPALFEFVSKSGTVDVTNNTSNASKPYIAITKCWDGENAFDIAAGTIASVTFATKEDITDSQNAGFELVIEAVDDPDFNSLVDDFTTENTKLTITVKPEVEEVYHTVNLPESPVGYTIAVAEGSESPVTEGGSFSFTVTVDTENYEGTPVVKANGNELTAVEGVYTIENISVDQTVTVEGITEKVQETATYTVNLPQGEGYTVNAVEGSVSPVAEGGSFSFTVTVDTENYEGNPAVKTNGLTLAATDGVYTISNITADQTVTVEGITEQGLAADKLIYKYLTAGTGRWPSSSAPVYINTLTLKGLSVINVEWDSSYENCTITLHKKTAEDASFNLAAEVGLFGNNPSMMSGFSAVVNGTTYSGSTFTHSGSLENGKAELTITAKFQNYSGTKNFILVVDGVSAEPEPATYEVTLTEGEGYTIAATEGSVNPVTEGGSFSFTVTVNEGYEGTPVVKANGTVLTAANGIYTIENIGADQTVTVEGITAIPNTYTVTLPQGEGYTVSVCEGSVSPVIEGGSFSFTVAVKNGYEGTPVVTVGDNALTAVDGVYTIADIRADQTVSVSGIAVKGNTYTVAASADATASKGDNAVVSVNVTGNSNSQVTGYNDYDVTVSYDPSMLTYVSAAAAHSSAEITHNAAAGTIRIVGHGEAKAYSDAVVTLNFTALASGSHAVTITSAKIDNSGNAIALDAPEAAVSDQTTVVKVAYPVTLPENFTGDLTVLPGGDYQFTAPNAYYDVIVTVDGEKVIPEVDGLVYTIRGINGNVVITAVGKTYDVIKSGNNASIAGNDTAQYGTDYSFTVAADSGYAVTGVAVQIGGVAADYTISGGNYIISGSKITGDVTITVTTQQQAANTTQITFEGVDASEVVGGLVQYATNGQDFTFELNEEDGYAYTAKLDEEELKPAGGVYTIPGTQINGTALTVTISKEVYSFAPEVNVSQYIQLDDTVMWLITATEGDNILAYGEGNTMFWSDKYNAYCWLVVSAGSEDTVKQAAESTIIAAAEGTVATNISYDFDVNQSGTVDINDAQLTYDMYQAKMYSGFNTVTMDKFLEADVNGDAVVNVEDAAAVVAQLLQ